MCLAALWMRLNHVPTLPTMISAQPSETRQVLGHRYLYLSLLLTCWSDPKSSFSRLLVCDALNSCTRSLWKYAIVQITRYVTKKDNSIKAEESNGFGIGINEIPTTAYEACWSCIGAFARTIESYIQLCRELDFHWTRLYQYKPSRFLGCSWCNGESWKRIKKEKEDGTTKGKYTQKVISNGNKKLMMVFDYSTCEQLHQHPVLSAPEAVQMKKDTPCQMVFMHPRKMVSGHTPMAKNHSLPTFSVAPIRMNGRPLVLKTWSATPAFLHPCRSPAWWKANLNANLSNKHHSMYLRKNSYKLRIERRLRFN